MRGDDEDRVSAGRFIGRRGLSGAARSVVGRRLGGGWIPPRSTAVVVDGGEGGTIGRPDRGRGGVHAGRYSRHSNGPYSPPLHTGLGRAARGGRFRLCCGPAPGVATRVRRAGGANGGGSRACRSPVRRGAARVLQPDPYPLNERFSCLPAWVTGGACAPRGTSAGAGQAGVARRRSCATDGLSLRGRGAVRPRRRGRDSSATGSSGRSRLGGRPL